MHTKNCSSSVLNLWINQKPSEIMPGNENTKSGILRGLFICRISELNPRTKTLHKQKQCSKKSMKNLKILDTL